MKAASRSSVSVRCEQIVGAAGGQSPRPASIADQPVEALGLFHIGGRDEHAHVGAALRGCGRSAPRTGGARADRRRSSARRGSADRGRGSARSTARASASCRPTACPPAGRGTAPDRCCRAARRCAHRARRAAWPNRRPKKSRFS